MNCEKRAIGLVALAVLFLGNVIFATPANYVPEFVIFVPSYNNEKYAKENLKSVCKQKSTLPYHVICVNDCSTDMTGKIMTDYVEKHNLQSMVTIINNPARIGATANFYHTINNHIADDKIVLCVDGDDLLAHDEVLLQLEEIYKDSSIWLTYGSCLRIPSGMYYSRELPAEVIKNRSIRSYPFVTDHLKTFRASLFKKIKKEDLMHDGEFLSMASDVAFMYPMLEMAIPEDSTKKPHIKYINKAMYIYRMNNPLNDFRVDKKRQSFLGKYITSKPRYKSLERLN